MPKAEFAIPPTEEAHPDSGVNLRTVGKTAVVGGLIVGLAASEAHAQGITSTGLEAQPAFVVSAAEASSALHGSDLLKDAQPQVTITGGTLKRVDPVLAAEQSSRSHTADIKYRAKFSRTTDKSVVEAVVEPGAALWTLGGQLGTDRQESRQVGMRQILKLNGGVNTLEHSQETEIPRVLEHSPEVVHVSSAYLPTKSREVEDKVIYEHLAPGGTVWEAALRYHKQANQSVMGTVRLINDGSGITEQAKESGTTVEYQDRHLPIGQIIVIKLSTSQRNNTSVAVEGTISSKHLKDSTSKHAQKHNISGGVALLSPKPSFAGEAPKYIKIGEEKKSHHDKIKHHIRHRKHHGVTHERISYNPKNCDYTFNQYGEMKDYVAKKEKIAVNFLVCKGESPAQASGNVGNIMQESTMDNKEIQNGGETDDPYKAGKNGYGLAQWTPGSKLIAVAKKYHVKGNVSSFKTQMHVIWAEETHVSPTGNYDMLRNLKKTSTPTAAAEVFEQDFEEGPIAAIGGGQLANRQNYASVAYREFGKGAMNDMRRYQNSLKTARAKKLQDKVVYTAEKLSYKQPIGTTTPTMAYSAAMHMYDPEAPYDGADCAGFVDTTIRASGVDSKFSTGDTVDEEQFMLDHPKKFKLATSRVTNTHELKPGDILVINRGTTYTKNGGIAKVGNGAGDGGHTFIYLGNKGENGYTVAEASGGVHSAQLENLGDGIVHDPLGRGSYADFRVKG